MNEESAIGIAATFLRDLGISFCMPGKVEAFGKDAMEVVFLVPEALDPQVAVVDPPDIRVIVFSSGEVRLVYQM